MIWSIREDNKLRFVLRKVSPPAGGGGGGLWHRIKPMATPGMASAYSFKRKPETFNGAIFFESLQSIL